MWDDRSAPPPVALARHKTFRQMLFVVADVRFPFRKCCSAASDTPRRWSRALSLDRSKKPKALCRIHRLTWALQWSPPSPRIGVKIADAWRGPSVRRRAHERSGCCEVLQYCGGEPRNQARTRGSHHDAVLPIELATH